MRNKKEQESVPFSLLSINIKGIAGIHNNSYKCHKEKKKKKKKKQKEHLATWLHIIKLKTTLSHILQRSLLPLKKSSPYPLRFLITEFHLQGCGNRRSGPHVAS